MNKTFIVNFKESTTYFASDVKLQEYETQASQTQEQLSLRE